MKNLIEHELAIIKDLRYEAYFLTVRNIMEFARSKGILCQGRGSAANSAVCYCLRITDVDPKRGDLLFERFISRDRNEPPDIDVDFEHERREEVMQHVFQHIRLRPCRHRRDRHHLPLALRRARGRQGLRPLGGCGRRARRQCLGLVELRRGRRRCPPRRARSGRTTHRAGARDVARDHRFSAPSLPACRRLPHHPQPPRRGGADPPFGDGRPQHHRMGQGRSRRPEDAEDRRARARHADGAEEGLRPARGALRREARSSPRSRRRSRKSTT